MSIKIIDLSLSFIATVIAFFLSWPFWRRFEYWAESQSFWQVYFVVGFVIAFYVFYEFLSCLRVLFLHDGIERKQSKGKSDK